MVAVAQLVEHLVVVQVAAGSSPVSHPKSDAPAVVRRGIALLSRIMARGFVIVHGWENRRPEGHWHRWLAGELRTRGELVSYAQYPSPDQPVLDDWLELFDAELRLLGPVDERVVVAHSLGALMFLHAATRAEQPLADRVLLVAPPGRWLPEEEAAVASFAFGTFPRERVVAAARAPIRLVCSDNDPYSRLGAEVEFGTPLGFDTELLAGTGHLSMDDGYGPWPAALNWCLDSTARIADGDLDGPARARDR